MANFQHRHPQTAPGRFYTDILCLDCFVCREAVPSVFALDEVRHTTYVLRQPETPDETAACEECLRRCPCEAIGNDGDLQDWSVRSFYSSLPEDPNRTTGDRCRITGDLSQKPAQEN